MNNPSPAEFLPSTNSDNGSYIPPKKRRKLSSSSQDRLPADEAASLSSLLCGRCEPIDFEKLFNIRKLTKDGKAIMLLDNLPVNPEDATCPVCRLFASVCNRDERFTKYHLRV